MDEVLDSSHGKYYYCTDIDIRPTETHKATERDTHTPHTTPWPDNMHTELGVDSASLTLMRKINSIKRKAMTAVLIIYPVHLWLQKAEQLYNPGQIIILPFPGNLTTFFNL